MVHPGNCMKSKAHQLPVLRVTKVSVVQQLQTWNYSCTARGKVEKIRIARLKTLSLKLKLQGSLNKVFELNALCYRTLLWVSSSWLLALTWTLQSSPRLHSIAASQEASAGREWWREERTSAWVKPVRVDTASRASAGALLHSKLQACKSDSPARALMPLLVTSALRFTWANTPSLLCSWLDSNLLFQCMHHQVLLCVCGILRNLAILSIHIWKWHWLSISVCMATFMTLHVRANWSGFKLALRCCSFGRIFDSKMRSGSEKFLLTDRLRRSSWVIFCSMSSAISIVTCTAGMANLKLPCSQILPTYQSLLAQLKGNYQHRHSCIERDTLWHSWNLQYKHVPM